MSDAYSAENDLQAVVAGDRQAFARLLVEHGDRLARRIDSRLQLNPFADFSADDVLQEAYIDAFRNIESFDLAKADAFAAWLTKIADNRLVSMLRERQRQKRGGNARRANVDVWRSSAAELVALLEDEGGCTPSENAARDEAAAAVHAQFEQLPEDQSHALRAYYLVGHSTESTAELMGKTNGAVRGLIHRAKQSMRVALGNSSRWFLKK